MLRTSSQNTETPDRIYVVALGNLSIHEFFQGIWQRDIHTLHRCILLILSIHKQHNMANIAITRKRKSESDYN